MGLDIDKIADDLGLPRDKFRAAHLTLHRPNVPEGSIRNLRALFTFPPATPSADQKIPKPRTVTRASDMSVAVSFLSCHEASQFETAARGGFVAATPNAVPDGMTLVRTDVVRFLCGMADLEGLWFGEDHPTERGAFWWRSRLPRVSELSAAPAPAGDKPCHKNRNDYCACGRGAMLCDGFGPAGEKER